MLLQAEGLPRRLAAGEGEQMSTDDGEGGAVLLVCGGRQFRDRKRVFDELSGIHMAEGIACVVHGNAMGADRIAGEWARLRGVAEVTVNANWEYHGKHAGLLRNGWMLKFARPDRVLAFPGGAGTLSMVMLAEAAGIPVKVLR
jgi:hypothetical protein